MPRTPSNATASEVGRLFDRKLLVQIGKGGVGKTALSAALGLAAHQTGRRVLLAEVRSSRRIPLMLGYTPAGDGPEEIAPRLFWMNLRAMAALEVYAMRLLRLRMVYRAVFEQQAVRRFLQAVPSLAEILILGHLRHLVDEGQHDLIVVDAPSTGPGALMLEAPQAVLETAPPGPLRDGAAWIRNLLADPEKTAVSIVVLLEELPVTEAIELYHRLQDRVAVPLGAVLANRILPDPFPPESEARIAAVGAAPGGQALGLAAGVLRSRLERQRETLARLRSGIDLPSVLLPEVLTGAGPRAVVDGLAQALRAMLEVAR